MCGSHSHAGGYIAEIQCIEHHGLLEGEKCFDDFRPVFKSKVQVWEPTFIGLCHTTRKAGGHDFESREIGIENSPNYDLPTQGNKARGLLANDVYLSSVRSTVKCTVFCP